MNTTERVRRYQEDLDRNLLECVLDAKKELLQELLDAGANALKIDREKGSPLSCAIASGDEEMVRMLLTSAIIMAEPCTAEGLPPLHLAAKEGQCHKVEILSENKADINSYSEKVAMPLQLACDENHVDVVESLIKHEDIGSGTRLHHTPERGFLRNAEILLRHGASVNRRCHNMSTPLHFAVGRVNVNVATLLLEHGAEVNARDGMNRTVLHFTSNSNRTEVVERLVKHGVDMNNVAHDVQPALHWACKMGYKDVVAVLLENGEDVNLESKRYGTPLEWALKVRKQKCVEVLERHIIKLKAASLYVLDSNLHAISAGANVAAFQKECEDQVQRMKQSKIHKSISFYDILAHDTNRVAVYAKNRVVHQAMMSGEYKTMFPIYAKMIENSFVKGQRRPKLLEASLESLNSLIGNRLPHMFVMDVLMYLNEDDHKNLIASTKEGESH